MTGSALVTRVPVQCWAHFTEGIMYGRVYTVRSHDSAHAGKNTADNDSTVPSPSPYASQLLS